MVESWGSDSGGIEAQSSHGYSLYLCVTDLCGEGEVVIHCHMFCYPVGLGSMYWTFVGLLSAPFCSNTPLLCFEFFL